MFLHVFPFSSSFAFSPNIQLEILQDCFECCQPLKSSGISILFYLLLEVFVLCTI